MCCRYWNEESEELHEIAEEMYRSSLVSKWQRTGKVKVYGEIRPTDVVPVIAPDRHGERAVFPMKWGFKGRSLLMNARVETAAVKPTFREAWERHRCAVPASWYFEWEHLAAPGGRKRTGDKYMIRPKASAGERAENVSAGGWPENASLTWLCGLYRIEEGLPVFVVLTREPGEGIRFIHDRMPLILPGEYVNDWIRPGAQPEAFLARALTDMAYARAAE